MPFVWDSEGTKSKKITNEQRKFQLALKMLNVNYLMLCRQMWRNIE